MKTNNSGTTGFKAEFEPKDALLLCWNTRYNDMPYRKVAEAVLEDGTALLVVCRDEADRENICTIFNRYAFPLEKIRFLLFDFASIWARDYAPLPLWAEGQMSGLAGYQYSKRETRANDNRFQAFLQQELDLPWSPHDLILSGGNFVTNGSGTVLCTDQILEENAGQEDRLRSFFEAHAVHRFLPVKRLEHEYTGHIDMLMKFVGPEVLLVAKLDPAMKDYQAMEDNVRSIRSAWPQCRIISLPLAPDQGSYENLGNVFYSYINAVILKKIVLLPLYGENTDAEAMDVYQGLFPDHTIKGIFCKDLVKLKGALHCMTAQI